MDGQARACCLSFRNGVRLKGNGTVDGPNPLLAPLANHGGNHFLVGIHGGVENHSRVSCVVRNGFRPSTVGARRQDVSNSSPCQNYAFSPRSWKWTERFGRLAFCPFLGSVKIWGIFENNCPGPSSFFLPVKGLFNTQHTLVVFCLCYGTFSCCFPEKLQGKRFAILGGPLPTAHPFRGTCLAAPGMAPFNSSPACDFANPPRCSSRERRHWTARSWMSPRSSRSTRAGSWPSSPSQEPLAGFFLQCSKGEPNKKAVGHPKEWSPGSCFLKPTVW